MKMKITITLIVCLIFALQIKSQNFYHMADSIEAVYAGDTSEGGPKATVERLRRRWTGQFDNAGKFTTAAQNYYNFAKGLINHRTATTGCSNFTPVWKEVGPTMTNDNIAGFKGLGAGEITSMCFHPDYDGESNQIIFALSFYGGIWKTTDDGEHWTRLNTDNAIPFSSFGILVIDPINPDRMYVTTGNSSGMPAVFGRSDKTYPHYTIGIYATNDGGNTWGAINNGLEVTNLFTGHCIHNFVIDPENHDNLIFTSSNGVYICTNASGSIGSQTWTKDSNFPFADNKLIGLTYNPTTKVWFISGEDIYSCANPFISHTWVSSTVSNGLDLSGGIFHDVGLGVAIPIMKINIVNSHLTGFTDKIYGMIFTTGTAGETALVYKTGNNPWQLLAYDNLLQLSSGRMPLVKSPNSNDMFLGSIYYAYYSTALGYIPNPSYGNNLFGSTAGSHHADLDGLYIHPSQPNKLWLCGDGGISKTNIVPNSSNASTFVYKNNGIQAHLLWGFDDSEQNPNYYLAALQDNGCLYVGGAAGNSWKMGYFGGDGYEASIFDKNPSDAFTTGNEHAGVWFNYLTGASVGAGKSMPLGRASYFASPSNFNDKILIGDYNLWKNIAGTWGTNNNFASSSYNLNYNSSTYTCLRGAFKGAYQNYVSGAYYYPAYLITHVEYTSNACISNPNGLPSVIKKSRIGFDTWSGTANYFHNVDTITNALYDKAKLDGVITASDLPFLTGITCNPTNGDKVWVCSASLNAGFKVWKSTNGGTTWENADPFLRFAKIPVMDIVALDGSLDMVFVGTLDGVYYTDNTMGGNWCKYGEGPSVQVLFLKINYCKNKLIVGTYGRGAFEATLPFQAVTSTNINANTTWNTPQNFPAGSVTVKAGKTLTIQNTTVKFGPNSRLYVEAGAKLVIDNATLTSASECDGYMWKGVELQGDINQKQILTSGYYPYHGWCVITNNGTIQNAEVGIKNFATVNGDGTTIDVTKKGGGIIQCTNAKFLNCTEGAKFTDYIAKNALNYIIADKSFFTSSQFLTDATSAVKGFTPLNHLVMVGTKGIGITSNMFKNVTPASFSGSKCGTGILAIDAAFGITTKCSQLVCAQCACPSYDTPNTFENLYYGIDAGASSATIVDNITLSRFTNNHRAIILRGTTQSSVTKNIINVGGGFMEPTGVGTGMVYSYPYGIYLDACDAYAVRENIIGDASNDATDVDYGIIVSNTGVNVNELKQNTFSKVAFGVQAQEENYGLQLKCNKFTAATIKTADVIVMGLQTQGSIAQQQGLCSPDPTTLPGNEFSHTCSAAKDLNTNSNVLHQVTYNTRSTPSAELPQSGCYNTTDYNVSLCFAAGAGDVCSPPSVGLGMRMAQLSPDQELIQMSQSISNKQQLLADADAPQLYSAIANNTDGNTLKQNLLQAGPYASDPLLLSFIDHSPAYADVVLQEVLVANSPLTATVMQAFNQLNIGKTAKNKVLAAQTGLSARAYLQNEIKYYTSARVLLYNRIISDVLNDTANVNMYDTLYAKLNFDISPQSRNIYISALMDQGKFGQAQAQIAIMRQTEASADNADYWEALLSLKQQSNKQQAYKNSSAISAKIESQSAKWPMGKSVNAGMVRAAIFGSSYKEHVYVDEKTSKAQRVMQETITRLNETESDLKILTYPNPANTSITFMINGKDEAEDCEIIIYDVNGRVMSQLKITENHKPQTLLLDAYGSGIYFYRALSGNKIVQNKLVIIK